MLSRLYIKNYALIEHLDLEFSKGFITITGQTGSGKSIVLGALSMVLGARVDTSVILNNTEKCVMEAHFTISNGSLKSVFERLDVDFDEHSIFRREVNVNGKSRAFINDMPVPLAVMKEIGKELIDIHVQHQTQRLNDPDYQMQLLDLYANNADLLKKYRKTYQDWKKAKLEWVQLTETRNQAIKEFDFVQFQLNELNEVGLEEVDFEKIQEDFELMSSSKDILEGLNRVNEALEGDSGMLDLVKSSIHEFDSFKVKNKDLKAIGARLESIRIELEDIAAENERLMSSIDFDPSEAEMIRTQLDQLNHVFYKHRVSDVKDLLRIKSEMEQKVIETGNLDEMIERVEKQIEEGEIRLKELSADLNDKRTKAAMLLGKRCEKILADLHMKNTRISFTVEQLEQYKTNGRDGVSLNFSPDGGITNLPINKVASGGEVSRVMLALKSLLAQKTILPTIIFDEIDTGVSGEVASMTAAILKKMSANIQVIAITHLPQVAACGDTQYMVSKEENSQRPKTKIQLLDGESRVNEIAKMLSATEITDEAIANAKVLLKN